MSDLNPFSTGGPYWDGSLIEAPPCPVCGAPLGKCPDGTWAQHMTIPPVDPSTVDAHVDSGPLRNYRVVQFGYETVMQLNDRGAAAYGDAATLIE